MINNNVAILDAVRDALPWHQVLDTLPEHMRDVYFYPEYVALHRFDPATQASLFLYRRAENVWFYPFLLTPILKVGKCKIEQKMFDIESAYGYGGPLANTEDINFLAEAHQAFNQWCVDQNVVAEFVRLHPLLKTEQFLDPNFEVVFDRESVSLNLARLKNDANLPFDKKACNMLRRAQGLGILAKAHPVNECFDQFIGLYLSNMERFGAAKYYFFGDEYFSSLKKLVNNSGFLVVAQKDGEWLSAAIFLKGRKWLHYHLSASDSGKRLPGSTNLVLYTGAKIGKGMGLEMLHLGGGLQSDSKNDSLLKFKQSMASDSHHFFIGKCVHNKEMYMQLRKLWEEQYPSLEPIYGQRLLCYRYNK